MNPLKGFMTKLQTKATYSVVLAGSEFTALPDLASR